jgi:hypothetical protein
VQIGVIFGSLFVVLLAIFVMLFCFKRKQIVCWKSRVPIGVVVKKVDKYLDEESQENHT